MADKRHAPWSFFVNFDSIFFLFSIPVNYTHPQIRNKAEKPKENAWMQIQKNIFVFSHF